MRGRSMERQRLSWGDGGVGALYDSKSGRAPCIVRAGWLGPPHHYLRTWWESWRFGVRPPEKLRQSRRWAGHRQSFNASSRQVVFSREYLSSQICWAPWWSHATRCLKPKDQDVSGAPLLKSILSSQRRLAAVETCYSAFFVSEHPQSPGPLAGKVTLQIEERLQIWVDGLDFSNTFERLERSELGWYESFCGGLGGIHLGWVVLRRSSVAAFLEQSSIPVHFGYEVNEWILKQLTVTFPHDRSEAKRTAKITTSDYKPFKTYIAFLLSFSPCSLSTLPQLSEKMPTG